jgi:WD40 repeat protein
MNLPKKALFVSLFFLFAHQAVALDFVKGNLIDTAISEDFSGYSSWTPNGHVILRGEDSLQVWNGDLSLCEYTLPVESWEKVQLTNDLLINAKGNTAYIWDIATGSLRAVLPHPAHVTSLAVDPEKKTLAAACWDQRVYLWDLKKGSLLQTLVPKSLKNYDPSDLSIFVTFSDDGQYICSAGELGEVNVWEKKRKKYTYKVRLPLTHYKDWTYSADFNPESTILVTTHRDSLAVFWDIKTGEEILNFDAEQDRFTDAFYWKDLFFLEFTPRTKSPYGGYEYHQSIWQVFSADSLNYQVGSENSLWSKHGYHHSFSPNGKTILSRKPRSGFPPFDSDSTVYIWDTERWEPIQTIHSSTGSIRSFEYSPDGHHILTSTKQEVIIRNSASLTIVARRRKPIF